jgi:hypothetical protein
MSHPARWFLLTYLATSTASLDSGYFKTSDIPSYSIRAGIALVAQRAILVYLSFSLRLTAAGIVLPAGRSQMADPVFAGIISEGF